MLSGIYIIHYGESIVYFFLQIFCVALNIIIRPPPWANRGVQFLAHNAHAGVTPARESRIIVMKVLVACEDEQC